ncbi:uncharacterized protein LOC144114157 [Amblyomma americanum]
MAALVNVASGSVIAPAAASHAVVVACVRAVRTANASKVAASCFWLPDTLLLESAVLRETPLSKNLVPVVASRPPKKRNTSSTSAWFSSKLGLFQAGSLPSWVSSCRVSCGIRPAYSTASMASEALSGWLQEAAQAKELERH